MERDNRLPARVNITLNIANKDAQEKKELPMRLLVLGDFSKKTLSTTETRQPLAKQERLAVTLTNYEQVLSYINPHLDFSIPNTLNRQEDMLSVHLSFNSMQDFHPKSIVGQVPVLQRLAAMKNLLKELRSNVIDNAVFKRKLQELLRDKTDVEVCQQELSEMRA